MIELVDVCKGYTQKGVRKNLIEDLNFTFPDDRNVAIMGHNGAGKSTLMRMLAGTEPPDSGRIYRSTRVSWPLGFSGGFNGTMTGIENVRFLARIYGADTEEVLDFVRDFAEIGPSIRLPVRTYSSGMKARLAFGVSMAIDFDTYLIDEITAVGDENFRIKSKKVFTEKLKRSNIVMISHSVNEIRNYCNCGLFLTRQGIRFYEDVEALIEDYRRTLREGF
ncbi:ABC transporter ATP-binding protein [Pseudooceanicola sp. CBS1P-1]|uniref:ATP-binding cassette domain-containing protein n=1 Tax=Pseudooceanicola albus TaxID=2692189 RepID=A0A6L7G8B8_9RHOB|nr:MULTISPECIES: ABC transporter ATP-binding protein [Pseudooceanicola]MBT9382897.1 ABC transporter ATP-binding protein [Pseudooceanicola endophyticus]MXN20179.1 ATP-binding cassette domain-containing protein [Pseudooceanicola albus]